MSQPTAQSPDEGVERTILDDRYDLSLLGSGRGNWSGDGAPRQPEGYAVVSTIQTAVSS